MIIFYYLSERGQTGVSYWTVWFTEITVREVFPDFVMGRHDIHLYTVFNPNNTLLISDCIQLIATSIQCSDNYMQIS